MLEKLSQKVYQKFYQSKWLNPVYVYTATCIIQGIWISLLVADAIQRRWFSAFIHTFCIAINSWTMYTGRRTMFMSIWHSAQHHQILAMQKMSHDGTDDKTNKPD